MASPFHGQAWSCSIRRIYTTALCPPTRSAKMFVQNRLCSMLNIPSIPTPNRPIQIRWLCSVAMALALLAASGVSAAAEPTPSPVAPAAAQPDPANSGEPASPVVADLESMAPFSAQAQDLQGAVPTAVSGGSEAGGVGEFFPRLAEMPPVAPSTTAESSVPVAQNAEGESAGGDAASTQADLARQSQNPIANLISVPFQNNTNFGVGQFDRTSNVLNIQPVIPTSINENWVLINRTIIPLAYQPELAPGVGNVFGLGDIVYQGFFSPKDSGSFTWGVGPAVVLPTATDEVLGSGKWSIGPAAVGLVTRGPIVAGALVNNVWSIAGDGNRDDVSLLTFQPFFNYNFDGGWYATTSPIINANWLAPGEKWTVPIGGGFGRVFPIGTQPVNMSLQGYWNAIRPEGAADWTLRAQVTLLFP